MKALSEKIPNSVRVSILLLLLSFTSCVSIEAIPYDEEKECWGAYEVVDTSLGGFASCEGALTDAEDEHGNFWRFDSTCLPSGFKKTRNLSDKIAWAPLCDEI